jgi:hypothetical protein
MPEPSEAELQSALLRRLTLNGWLAVRINSGAHMTKHGHFFRAYLIHGMPQPTKNGRGAFGSSAGFPDVIALKGDPTRPEIMIVRLFELKRAGGKLSDAQKQFREFARTRGVEVEIVEGLADLERLRL